MAVLTSDNCSATILASRKYYCATQEYSPLGQRPTYEVPSPTVARKTEVAEKGSKLVEVP